MILDPAIQQVNRLVAEYEVSFRDSPFNVRFRIWETTHGAPPSRRFYFEQSHYFHGPNQGTPYVTSDNSADSEEHALQRGIDTILNDYKPTIGKLIPQESWLIKNPHY